MKTRDFLAILLIFLAGCGFGGGGGGESQPERLRIIHAAPDEDGVDVYLGDTKIASNLTYGNTTGYLEALEGDQTVRFTAPDNAFDLLDVDETIAAGADHTFILIEENNALSQIFITDDNTEPDIGQIHLRFINLAPALDNFDVYVTRPDDRISNNDPTIAAMVFKDISDYLAVNEGQVRIRITNSGSKKSLINSGTLNVSAGQVLTFLVLDDEGGGTPVQSLLLVDKPVS